MVTRPFLSSPPMRKVSTFYCMICKWGERILCLVRLSSIHISSTYQSRHSRLCTAPLHFGLFKNTNFLSNKDNRPTKLILLHETGIRTKTNGPKATVLWEAFEFQLLKYYIAGEEGNCCFGCTTWPALTTPDDLSIVECPVLCHMYNICVHNALNEQR